MHRLTLAVADHDSASARLGPAVARALIEAPDAQSHGITVLALKRQDGTTVHVGFAGDVAAGGDGQLTLDRSTAAAAGLKEGETLGVSVRRDVPAAKTVAVEPAAASDWEILSLNGGHVEAQLLGQVRVVATGQDFSVRVGSGAHVRLGVTLVEAEDGSLVDCAILVPDSEVHVAPKARSNVSSPSEDLVVVLRTAFEECDVTAVNPSHLKGSGPWSLAILRAPALAPGYVDGGGLLEGVAYRPLTPLAWIPVKADIRVNEDVLQLSRETAKTFGIIPQTLVQCALRQAEAPAASADASGCNGMDGLTATRLVTPPVVSSTLTLVNEAVEDALGAGATDATALRGGFRPNILVTGAPGAGKSSLLSLVAQNAQNRWLSWPVSCAAFANLALNTLQKRLALTLSFLEANAPSVILLDNAERLFGRSDDEPATALAPGAAAAALFVAQLRAVQSRSAVAVIAVAPDAQALAPAFGDAGVFSHTVNVPAWDQNARATMLQGRFGFSEAAALAAARGTDGCAPRDLVLLAARAMRLRGPDGGAVGPEAVAAALTGFVPLAVRNATARPGQGQGQGLLPWARIAGMDGPKAALAETLVRPTLYAPLYAQCAVRQPLHVLLYGYPGTGKTMLAMAVAQQAGMHLVTVKGPELLGKYIGQSERAVRDLFERAQQARPCLLLFDEFESLAPRRGNDNTGVTDRVVNQLLTLLDGAEGLEGVHVVATTSRPDLIDPALLRPGRLDRKLLCDFPDESARAAILRELAGDYGWEADDELWRSVSGSTAGFTGADLRALLQNAAYARARVDQSATPKREKAGPVQASITIVVGDDGVTARAAPGDLARAACLVQGTGESGARAGVSPGVLQAPLAVLEPEHLREALREARASVSSDQRARLSRIYASFAGGSSVDLQQVGQRQSLR